MSNGKSKFGSIGHPRKSDREASGTQGHSHIHFSRVGLRKGTILNAGTLLVSVQFSEDKLFGISKLDVVVARL